MINRALFIIKDDIDLPTKIGFGVDNELIHLPKSEPHCVPHDMQAFLAKFIDEYYRLFDTRGRSELHACYHDSCMFSLCIAPTESSVVPTKSFKYGALIYESRNLKKIYDDNKRTTLLRHGKTDVLDFLRIKFPLTKHDGNSFHVDVFSTSNNRAIFTVNGLYRELDQGNNAPIRSFQRTFTCSQTSSGVLIIADHIMIINATDSQVLNMARAAPPTNSSIQPSLSSSQIMESQISPVTNTDVQAQMIQKFSEQSGMNIEFSRLCLFENNWIYEKAAQKFQECQKMNLIPPEAFKRP
jgi:nuclear RNA export factor